MYRLALLSGLAGAAMLAGLTAATAADYKVAFLAASSQNGYNEGIYTGIQKAAKELGNVDVEIFDGQFDATKQYSQVEDIVAQKQFNAIIIAPNDTVGIAPALAEATKAGIKVAATLFPVGPKLDDMQPQVQGLTTTVAIDPGKGAEQQAEAVADYCASKNPCNVAVIVGQLIFPFDNLRNAMYKKVLGQHPNIKIVATVEGNYDPDQSMKAMQDVLQAHPNIDAVLSTADQQVTGAEIALSDAGIDPGSVYLIGGGADQIAIDDIRAGKMAATLSQPPVTTGYEAMKAMYETLSGKTAPTYIDPTATSGAPAIIDRKWLDAHPDYKAEWQG